eukprot:16126412-Heterocapsa_arctica.AAC.1
MSRDKLDETHTASDEPIHAAVCCYMQLSVAHQASAVATLTTITIPAEAVSGRPPLNQYSSRCPVLASVTHGPVMATVN